MNFGPAGRTQVIWRNPVEVSMQRNGTPRAEHDEDDLQEQESAPSFLTARELEAKPPRKSPTDDGAMRRGATDEDDQDLEEPAERTPRKGGRKPK
jgi:hypothetical protein